MVEPDGLCGSPGEEGQHEVVQKGSTEATHNGDRRGVATNQEEHIESNQGQTHVHQDEMMCFTS